MNTDPITITPELANYLLTPCVYPLQKVMGPAKLAIYKSVLAQRGEAGLRPAALRAPNA